MIWIVAMGTSCETWLYHTQQPGRFEINFLDSGHYLSTITSAAGRSTGGGP
jgi:hypothetical protein